MPMLWNLLVAAVGAALANLAGLPLPFLLGPIFACLIAALAGLRMQRPRALGGAARTILGVAVGATITPDLIARLPDLAISIALVPLYLVAAFLIGYPLFRRGFGFDPATSFYGAMPGGLQDMILFGELAGGAARSLSLMHATRVLVVVTTMPFLLVWVFDLQLTAAPGAPASDIPVHELLVMIACAALGWWGAHKIGLFGASILGPMALAAAVSLGDIIHARPPAEALIVAQFVIGMGVGGHYTGITIEELRRIVAASLIYVLLLGLVSLAFALLLASAGLMTLTAALMAYAPGGQAEMAVLAIVAGIDVAIVVAHHLVRLVLVITLAPLIQRRWLRPTGHGNSH